MDSLEYAGNSRTRTVAGTAADANTPSLPVPELNVPGEVMNTLWDKSQWMVQDIVNILESLVWDQLSFEVLSE